LKTIKLSTIVPMVFLALTGLANASSLPNGSFESGDTFGWVASPAEYVSIVAEATAQDGTVYYPTDGVLMAELQAGDPFTLLYSEPFLAGPGYAITFDALFLAFDIGGYPDGMDWFLNMVIDGYSAGALAENISNVDEVGDYGASGWMSVLVEIPEFMPTGMYTIGVAVNNFGDFDYDSFGYVDKFTIAAPQLPAAAISEPQSLALIGLGLIGILALRTSTARTQ